MTASITDFGQFASLKASAERDDASALHEVASQFEALFVQSMLKNMRGAKLAEPMFGSEQMDMYTDMFDQQLSLEMANGRGIGLADMLVRQMGGEVGHVPTSRETYALPGMRRMDGAGADLAGSAGLDQWSGPDEFVSDIWPDARRVAQQLDVAPQALVAQAALETGWGAHVMRDGTGESSFNLFGIKADRSWSGDSVARSTVEYRDGVAERRVERFRAYPDVAAAFDDYAEFIQSRPRYDAAQGQGSDMLGFATALQDAGYATDPRYAEKIGGVLKGETLQQALKGLKITDTPPISLAGSPTTAD